MSKRKVILMGTPYYGNLGDIAIYYAEKKFLEDTFGKDNFYYIPEVCVYKYYIEKIKPYINDEDIIFLQGGGNMGNTYIWFEEIRRKVISTFLKNKIFIFPQTISFENTIEGNKELEITEKIYNAHNNLNIMAREKKSYEIMKKVFKNNNVFLTPDIVTYLNETNEVTRNGALVILRDDIESNLEKIDKERIILSLKKQFNDIKYSDTHLGSQRDYVWEYERKDILDSKFEEFRKAKLVITDRLHGMIFAAITSTPCIALSNSNHKIKYSAEWFENLNYIKFVDNVDNIDKEIVELSKIKKYDKYTEDFYKNKFEFIINSI